MRALRVIGPCDNDWDAMQPREGGRHCAACDRTVVDLSRLTRREVEALMRARTGRMCARVARDAEGFAVFREDPSAESAPAGVSALAGGAALAAALMAAGCGTSAAATSRAVPLVAQEQLATPPEPNAPTMVPTPPGAPAPVLNPPPPPPPAPAAVASASGGTATAASGAVTIPVRTGTKVRHHSAVRPPISSFTVGDMEL